MISEPTYDEVKRLIRKRARTAKQESNKKTKVSQKKILKRERLFQKRIQERTNAIIRTEERERRAEIRSEVVQAEHEYVFVTRALAHFRKSLRTVQADEQSRMRQLKSLHESFRSSLVDFKDLNEAEREEYRDFVQKQKLAIHETVETEIEKKKEDMVAETQMRMTRAINDLLSARRKELETRTKKLDEIIDNVVRARGHGHQLKRILEEENIMSPREPEPTEEVQVEIRMKTLSELLAKRKSESSRMAGQKVMDASLLRLARIEQDKLIAAKRMRLKSEMVERNRRLEEESNRRVALKPDYEVQKQAFLEEFEKSLNQLVRQNVRVYLRGLFQTHKADLITLCQPEFAAYDEILNNLSGIVAEAKKNGTLNTKPPPDIDPPPLCLDDARAVLTSHSEENNVLWFPTPSDYASTFPSAVMVVNDHDTYHLNWPAGFSKLTNNFYDYGPPKKYNAIFEGAEFSMEYPDQREIFLSVEAFHKLLESLGKTALNDIYSEEVVILLSMETLKELYRKSKRGIKAVQRMFGGKKSKGKKRVLAGQSSTLNILESFQMEEVGFVQQFEAAISEPAPETIEPVEVIKEIPQEAAKPQVEQVVEEKQEVTPIVAAVAAQHGRQPSAAELRRIERKQKIEALKTSRRSRSGSGLTAIVDEATKAANEETSETPAAVPATPGVAKTTTPKVTPKVATPRAATPRAATPRTPASKTLEERRKERLDKRRQEAAKAKDTSIEKKPEPEPEPEPVPVVDEKEETLKILRAGAILLKHGRRGKPAQRFVAIDETGKQIMWKIPNKPFCHVLTTSEWKEAFDLQQVTSVSSGQTTKVFARNSGQRGKEDVSFSLIAADRTLDFEADTVEQKDQWVKGFGYLITH